MKGPAAEMMKTMLGMGLEALFLVVGSALGQGLANEILTVSPEWAPPGTNGLTVTFTLDTDAPPAPPSGMPTSVMIGSISSISTSRPATNIVSGVFNIPAGESLGAKDCVITFEIPPGNAAYLLEDGALMRTANTGSSDFVSITVAETRPTASIALKTTATPPSPTMPPG